MVVIRLSKPWISAEMFFGGILDLSVFGAFSDPYHGAAVRADVGFNVAFGFQPLQGGGELTPARAFGL